MLERACIRSHKFVSIPDGPNQYAAADGLAQQGIPISMFRDLQASTIAEQCGPAVMVCGHIGDTWACLRAQGRPIPEFPDYPAHLKWSLGRDIEKRTLGWLKQQADVYFVKPVILKKFTGFVWDPEDPRSVLNIACFPDDVEVWVSTIITGLVSEWRCFVKKDKLIGVKHYKGRWNIAPSELTVNVAVRDGRGKMPAAYALDFGVASNGQTTLIEANDGYSIGCYGLSSIVYARFLEARWAELFGVESNA